MTDNPSPNRSLFVVSLPRSLSTVAYEAARAAVRLRAPEWTEAGEILNGERMPFWPSASPSEGEKFSVDEKSWRWRQFGAFLDDIVMPAGWAYKDVVQPFVVAKWLKGSGLAILRIHRPVAHVAWSMLRRHWTYPSNAASAEMPVEDAVILGLQRAAQALDTLDAVTVQYDQIADDEHVLDAALQQLYAGADPAPARYIDRAFAARRDSLRRSLLEDEAQAFIERAERLLRRAHDERAR
jgi:hypothetical protein